MSAITAARRREAIWLFLAAALVIAAGIGLRDPWPADEPRFALVAKQMVESGQYLFPHRGSELYSDKPPVFMWLQAASFWVSGNWRIAFLLPSLLASLGTLWLTYDLSRRLATRRAALIATAALATSVHFAFQAKAAQIDATATFLVTLSCYGLLRHLLKGPAWGWWWLGWFAAGLGTITKGVGGLALLLLVPYALMRWRDWRGLAPIPLRDWRWWIAPLFFLIALALWLGPMLLAVQASGDPALRAYADDILFNQTAKRYAHAWHHKHPAWYYVPVLLLHWMPLSLSYPWTVPAIAQRFRRQRARVWLPLSWALLIVAFFSLSAGKRDVYILPALPMVCVAFAAMLPGVLRKVWPPRLLFGLTAALGLVCVALGAWAWLGDPSFKQRLSSAPGAALWVLMLAIGAATLLTAALLRPRRGAVVWAVFAALLWSGWGLVAGPQLNDASSARGIMRDVSQRIGPDAELAMVAWKEQDLYQADRPVTDWGFLTDWDTQRRAAFVWLREAPDKRWVFILEQALGNCVDREHAIALGKANRRAWWLLRADSIVPGCVDSAKTGSYDPFDVDDTDG